MMATVCRCCGSCIPDSRERRKLSSQAGVAVIPTLVGLLHVHFGGQKSHNDIERLLTSERFICRQCLLKLQRLQKLKKDVVDLRANIVGSMEALYPSQIPPQPAESSADPTSSCVLGKRTSSQEVIPPPAKRALVTSPAARRQLHFSVAPPEVGKSPSVTVHT